MAALEDTKPAEKRRALGRGLDALLPSGPRVVPAPAAAVVPPPAAAPARIAEIQARAEGDLVELIALDLIDENPYQTRRTFDAAALAELAESIKANGLAQPVVVRPGNDGRYVLVLGERRCRACRLAGKASVPAIVRPMGNEQAAEMTIVENMQRQDLTCLEQAEAFARLSREFNLTQEQIGQRTGVSRESVANYMRVLKLPKGALELLGQQKIGFSEARALLEGLPHLGPEAIEELAYAAVKLGLTVRDLKERIDNRINPELHKPEPREEKPVDPNVRDAERRLRETLGMRVRVMAYQGNKGQIVIRYESLADFDRVLELLGRDAG